MLKKTTKQIFEIYLDNHCDNTSFRIVRFEDAVSYFWYKNDVIIASQTILYGQTRRIYEVNF